jgi:branched-chain amino acid transport system permease protein
MRPLAQQLLRASRGRLGEASLLAVLLAAPLVLASGDGYRIYLSQLMVVYAGAAVGLTILLGVARQFHLGQAAFMAVGAYAAAIISARSGSSLPFEFGVSLAVGGLLGLAVGVATLRLSGMYFGLATLAVVLGVQSLAANWTSLTNGPVGFTGIPAVTLFGGQLSSDQTYLCVAVLLFLQGIVVFGLRRSTYWGALKLIGDRDYLASCIGIRVLQYRVWAFVIVSMVGACWGALYAHVVGFIDPTSFGLSLTVQLLMMVVLGGLGSFWGAIIGAIVLVEIPEWLASIRSDEQLVYGGILLVVVLVLPRGVLPMLRSLVLNVANRWRESRGVDPEQAARSPVGLLSSPMSFDGASLNVTDIDIQFGGVHVLRGASLRAAPGKIEGLIGPNGSGKTTMLNAVSGVVACDAGSIVLDGEEIRGIGPNGIANRGLLRTFQTPQVVLDMTALENAVLGWHQRRSTNIASVALGLPAARREEARQLQEARAMCSELALGDVLDRPAGELSTGDRRFVEIARALGSKPRLLFLDEPATGLTGLERERLMLVLDRLRASGLTLVVIDHDMEFLFQMADHVTVLNRGAIIATGSPDEVRAAPSVIDAYFGEAAAHA